MRFKGNHEVGQQPYVVSVKACMQLGIKAQRHCISSSQVLAEMKSPRPMAFVNQIIVNNVDDQQLNNRTSTSDYRQ